MLSSNNASLSQALREALKAPPTANEPDPSFFENLPKPKACPDCNGAGFYKYAVPLGHPDFGVLQTCECKKSEIAANQLRHEEKRRNEILSTLQDELGALSKRRLENFDTKHSDIEIRRSLQNALQEAHSYVANGYPGWLYFYGPCGAGKSHLAAGIAIKAAQDGMPVTYVSAPRLFSYLKKGFADGSADSRLEILQNVDLLVLDDVGTEIGANSAYTNNTYFDLLNQRQIYGKSTVITTNLHISELEDRIASRVKRAGRIILIDADDYSDR